eukprot:GHVS01036317.1.p1 GENE.GHVS01036317.1~~GHVS01036317.1.p1  ORF type:complete len:428 (-),score=54.38 GHVS01036317.1:137-1324(-)
MSPFFSCLTTTTTSSSCSPVMFAVAWNVQGHEAIGMTAMSALKGGALSQIKRLMNGKDVVDVSNWAHKVNQKFPVTSPLHFFRQTDWQCSQLSWQFCTRPGDSGKRSLSADNSTSGITHRGSGPCVINALRSLYGRLVNRKELQVMEWPADVKLSDSDAVKYIINLIGDLHQPLHVGFDSNDMGRDVMGEFTGPHGKKKRTSLFSYWDDELISKIVEERPQSWNSGWTHVHSIRQVYEDEKKKFAQKKEECFDDWAAESLKIVCDSIYTHPGSNQRITKKFSVDLGLEAVWFELMRQRLLLAGARVAIVLNDILQTREASKLRVGTSVVDVEEDLIGGTPVPRQAPSWVRNLFTNLAIVSVVLALFAYISRYYSSTTPTHTRKPAAERELTEKSS